jgi:hypothetical protein
MTPVWSAWKFFPTSKGTATGAVLLGYGFGPSLFGLVFTFLTNPNNDQATVHVTNGAASYYLFDHMVANNIPSTLRYFALILGVIYLISVLLISDPDTESKSQGQLQASGQLCPAFPNVQT